MKYALICSLILILCIGIGIGISLIIRKQTKLKKKRYVFLFTSIISIFLLFVCFFSYVGIYYHADSSVKEYLKSSDSVTVTKISSGYYFDGKGSNKAIIFYPGAKVEYTSYALLMYDLASEGIDCFLVKMPFNLAFFGSNKANSIIKNYDYESYYLMGHSLGGSMASLYASSNSDKIDGVILLASYSTKKLDMDVLSIYGSNDGCLNLKEYEKNKTNLPSNYKEVIIDGGNHAQFGSYGKQKGDKKATISNELQKKYTICKIIDFLNI